MTQDTTLQFSDFKTLVEQFTTGMLITSDGDDSHGRPMVVADVCDDGKLWFISPLDTPKVDELLRAPNATVTFQKDDLYLSVSGNARIRQDRKALIRLWNSDYDAWFDGGPMDSSAAVVEFKIDHAEYWSRSLAQRLRYIVELAKTRVFPESTIDAAAVGDSGSINVA